MEIPTWVYFIDGPITTYLNRNTTKYFHNLKGLSTCKFYKLVNKKKKKKKTNFEVQIRRKKYKSNWGQF